jgi:hypothetical protein
MSKFYQSLKRTFDGFSEVSLLLLRLRLMEEFLGFLLCPWKETGREMRISDQTTY